MPERFDPYSNEARYTLDYLCYLVARQPANCIQIVSADAEVAKAVVRRLAPTGAHLAVETEEIAATVAADLGLPVNLALTEGASVALCPWLDPRMPLPAAARLVGSVRNVLSYKSLRQPVEGGAVAPAWLQRLDTTHVVRSVAGYFPPACVALLALAGVARRRHPSYGYYLSDLAMQRVFTTGPAWRLSYVVLFSADRR